MKKLDQAEVVARFCAAHGDKYDYSKVRFAGTKEKVEIICPEHGSFYLTAGHHMRGVECRECGRKKASGARRLGEEGFVVRAQAVHGEKYDYSKANYGVDNSEKVEIVCPEHGSFWQSPANHLSGKGCKRCADVRTGEARMLSLSDFVVAARAVHGDKYDYSKAVYLGANEKVEIVCSEHGSFWQIATNHVSQESDCPDCLLVGTSKAELDLFAFVKAICPDAINGDRSILGGREIDIYVPSLKLGIEYNGIYSHSTKFKKDVFYHQKKTDDAAAVGVRLVHIWSDEWLLNRRVIEGYLQRLLGAKQRRIFARQCEMLPVVGHDVRDFLEQNHLQGFGRGGSGVALLYQGEVVGVALVVSGELSRWCVRLGVDLVGGFSRALSRLPRPLISYCDMAKHTGDGYLKAGWVEVLRRNIPQTFYVCGKRRLSRHAGVVLAGGMSHRAIEAAGLLRLNGCSQKKFLLLH